MQHFRTSPREMAASVWRNRNLILALTKREVVGCYRGSVTGITWSFFSPIRMLLLYTFVFFVREFKVQVQHFCPSDLESRPGAWRNGWTIPSWRRSDWQLTASHFLTGRMPLPDL